MKREPHQYILKEIQDIKRRLNRVERQAMSLQKVRTTSHRDDFQKKYPTLSPDSRLFKLVGIDPPLSVAEGKKAIREAIAGRFEAK